MYARRMLLHTPAALVVGVLTLLLLAGCGTTTGANNQASATSTACPTRQISTVSGILQSINGNTLLIQNNKGQSVNAIYDSTTRFTHEVKVDSTAIQNGMQASVFVKQNQDNTYTATRISLMKRTNTQGNGNQGNGNGNRNQGNGNGQRTQNAGCFQRLGQQGKSSNTNSGASNSRAITGAVGQMNGSTLTVSDFSGNDYTVTIDKSTSIIQTQDATARDLHAGASLSVVGKPAAQGSITAQQVIILLSSSIPTGNQSGG